MLCAILAASTSRDSNSSLVRRACGITKKVRYQAFVINSIYLYSYKYSCCTLQGTIVLYGPLVKHQTLILVWPTSWTPTIGGLIVYVRACECVRVYERVSLCVRRHVAILLGA